MLYTHKTFLSWLLYAVVAVFAYVGLTLFGVTSLVLVHDHTHLALALFGLYAVAEALVAMQAVEISREHRALLDLRGLTREVSGYRNPRRTTRHGPDGQSTIQHNVPLVGVFAEHVRALVTRASGGDRQKDQRLLVEVMAERMARRAEVGAFLASRIVWVGILATVLGVVLAFWPFLAAGGNIEASRATWAGSSRVSPSPSSRPPCPSS